MSDSREMSSQARYMQLHLGEFGPVRVFGRTLIIVCAYRGGAKQEARFWHRLQSVRYVRSAVRLVTLAPLRAYIASMRDHFANPRSLDVQLGMVRTLVEQGRVDCSKAILDGRLGSDEAQRLLIGAMETETADLARWTPVVRDIDSIILAYPDALGLTFGGLERRLLAAGARNIVVVTGRRRLFPLSSRAMRSLRWRRLLASTRIMELMAAFAVVPVAAVLAGYDSLKTRTRSRS